MFSIACWLRPEAHTDDALQTIARTAQSTNEVGWYLGYENRTGVATKAFRFITFDGGGVVEDVDFIIENQISSDGEWHHICFTCDASTLRFYLDGTQADTVAVTASTDGNSSRSLLISDSINEFEGYMADMRIYNDELTSGEIADIISGTNVAGNLQSHYMLNAADVLDYGALANDGTNNDTVHKPENVGDYSTDGPLD